MSSEMEDNMDEYLVELVNKVPSAQYIIDNVLWNGLVFKGFVSWCPSKGTSTMLSQQEVKMMLNLKYVQWERFHTDLLQSIYDNRATNKTNASIRAKNHTDKKFQLMSTLAREFPNFLTGEGQSQARKERWVCGVDALAADFARVVEHSIVNGQKNMALEIDNILNSDWSLRSPEHEETIYYIAGFILQAVHNHSTNTKNRLAHHYATLEMNASTTAEKAKAAKLPIGKVQEKEARELHYPTGVFYEVITTIESVFATMMNEDNIVVFGTLMVADLIEHLGKVDLGLSPLVPGAEEEVVTLITQAIINTYANLRGKDFARKRNARKGDMQTETTRATLGTIEYLNKLKKQKRKKEAEEAKKAAAAGGDKNTSTDTTAATTASVATATAATAADTTSAATSASDDNANGGIINNNIEDDVAKMKVKELKVELRRLGLPVSGLKATLQERVRAGREALGTESSNTDDALTAGNETVDDVPEDVEAMVAEELDQLRCLHNMHDEGKEEEE